MVKNTEKAQAKKKAQMEAKNKGTTAGGGSAGVEAR
jgi:hypothetical protein